jgi:CRISPR-associated protein Cas1
VADILKFETVVPIAFSVASKTPQIPESAVRHACRESFRKTKILSRIIPIIEEVLDAGEVARPDIGTPESTPMVIPNKESIGDAGHR